MLLYLSSSSSIKMKSGGSAYVAMAVVQVAYGGSNVLMKVALQNGLNQLVFVVYRHVLATLLLSPFAYVLERKQRPPLTLWSTAQIFVLASLGTTLHLNLYYAGLNYTSPTVASALSSVIPSLTLAIAVLLRMESVKLSDRRGRAKVLGTLVSVAGSLIFTFWKGERVFRAAAQRPLWIRIISGDEQQSWVKGSLLILASYVAWSAWLIVQAIVCKAYPARLSLNVLICFFASLQSAFLAMFWGRNPDIWKIGWDMQLFTILYCGIVISSLVYYLQTWCISKKGPVFVSMFSPLLLVIVGLFSALAFGERLHLGSLVGAVVIIVGLYCVLWGKMTDNFTEEAQTSRKNEDIPVSSRGNDHK